MKYISVIARTMLGGMSNNVSKLAINEIPMYYFLIIRYTLITLLTFILSPRKIMNDAKTNYKNKKLMKSLMISGVLSGFGTIFFYIGLKELPISMVSLLDNIFHISFVLLIGIIFLKHRRSKKYYLYFFLIFPSMYLVMFKDLKIELTFSLLGVFMLMMNGLVSAIDVHLTKKQLNEISVSTNVMIKSVFSGIIAIVCMVIAQEDINKLFDGITLIVGGYILFNITNTYLIKMLHTKSIKDIGAEQTTVFLALTPIFSIVFSVFIFKEQLTITQWIGILLTVVFLTKLKKHDS